MIFFDHLLAQAIIAQADNKSISKQHLDHTIQTIK